MNSLSPGTWTLTVSVLFAEGVLPSTWQFDQSVRAWSRGNRNVLADTIGVSTARAPNPNSQLLDTTRSAPQARKKYRLTSSIVVTVQRETLTGTVGVLLAEAIRAAGVEVDVGTLSRAFSAGDRIVTARVETATMTVARTTPPRAPARPALPAAPSRDASAPPPPTPVVVNPPAPAPFVETMTGATVVQSSDPAAVGQSPPTSSTVQFALLAAGVVLVTALLAYVATRKSS